MILSKIKIARRIGALSAMLLVLSTLASCFKDFTEDFLFTEKMVEIDATTWESKAPGKTYPIKGPYEKGAGVQTYQVNLIGGQFDTDQTLHYRIVPEETTATEGTHFRVPEGGEFVIPANSSVGYLSIEVLDFPAEAGRDTVVLELVGNDAVKVSENYKRLGLAILLTGPPVEGHALHEQLGPDSYYNSIYFDPLNPYIPADIRQRIEQSAANLAAQSGGPRRLHSMYIYFGNDNLVTVVAQYYGGGGNGLSVGAYATWTYEMVLDAQGIGSLVFKEANGNGNSQRTNFYPILGDYLEKHEFKVDWVDPTIATPDRPEVQLGGLFRTDDPTSYILGPLATLNATGSIRPFPSSPAMHDLFTDGDGGYFTTLYIDPASSTQSPAFQTRWQEAYDAVFAGIGTNTPGRRLHKMLFYFDPTFNFQDVRVVNYYYTASGAKFMGPMRFQWRVDYDGHVKPFAFIFQDANGGATRAPQLIDNFLMVTEFAMTRTGDRIKFTSVDDPSVYFEGELSNHPLNVNTFWPE
ncbi:DUF4843 domain-containing protein [Sphingobacterium sp. SGG-5]|uniref:DUF4843 domain-containing protein n=1 Tax=Sphingobacterium sp. SGG-5 TaxID=2710881 RepID=UPI0013EC91FA|nr:DUF4843 domain-containing protein [Sphingobacterium sp. SGG-5]NGM60399.1 DUF4843 domain-containing protein [Sphingobacterium sp. SGG-5]